MEVNLWSYHEEPFGPIYPNESPDGSKGMWQPLSVSEKCRCGQLVEFPINSKRLEHNLFLYGDEADRPPHNGYEIICYSLISGTSGLIAQISDEVRALKSKFVPMVDPNNWRIHCTDMKNARKRFQNRYLKTKSKTEIDKFLLDCARILQDAEYYSWNSAIFGFRKTKPIKRDDKKSRRDGKQLAVHALFSANIYRATKQKLRPVFTLDATKPTSKIANKEAWASNPILGSRHYAAHEFLTHGNHIHEPSLVMPGSNPCLELADVHAYHLARELDRRSKRLPVELELSNFGKFYYMEMKTNHRVEFFIDSSIPTNKVPNL